MKNILWFNEIIKKDVALVGGKNANLGEMTNKTEVPIPPGFAITTNAYKYFIKKNKLQRKIIEELRKLIDPNDTRTLRIIGGKIRRMVLEAKMPKELEKEILENYALLEKKTKIKNPFVAVRSSATAEDAPEASFAGQQETYLNVTRKDLIEKVKKCFASLFTDRAIFYRVQQGFPHSRVFISVAVQLMVNSKSAGVIFTLDPATGDDTKIVIEGAWGLGESVVSGAITPDNIVFDKTTMRVVKKQPAEKEIEYVRDKTGKTIHAKIAGKKRKMLCLTDNEIRKLAEYALVIERHYGCAQDIEWAIDRDLPFPNSIFIVQSRPETVWIRKKKEKIIEEKIGAKPVCHGLPASPGTAAGIVKIIPSIKQIEKIRKGDLLVTKMTTPDWVPAMRKASAIITEDGGLTCHAAIVSRELGIPSIVGVPDAMSILQDGEKYTVDAKEGYIYAGVVQKILEKKVEETFKGPFPKTKTKIYMNLGVPEKIKEYKDLPFDGIGLMRVEFIIASYVNQHPNDLLEKGLGEKYVNALAEGIKIVAKEISPRPVVVRFSDFKTNEYRALKGGEKYEPEEANPMIGWRGCSRYVSLDFEGAFRLECKAIKKVRKKWKNVWIMLPFVRTVQEVEKCIKIMESEGLKKSEDFKVWLMLEVPSLVFLINEFCKLPIDGFSIGSNDLTQLILGADRDSEILARMGYFDERNPAVLKALKIVIEGALKNRKTISICGQAPSVYPEIAEFLVKHGISSVSINPDTVVKTRKIVADAERGKNA